MNEMIKYVLAVFYLVILPFFAGVPLLKRDTKYMPAESFFMGYLVLFSTGEILTLILIAADAPLQVLVYAVTAIYVGMALLGIVELFMKKKQWLFPEWKFPSLYLLLALVVIAVQLYTLIRYAHFDADDSFYVGTSATGVYTNTIFSVNPYTGKAYTELPRRYLFSQYPVFLSIISKLTGNLSPLILAHTVFPVVFVGMAYLLQSLFAKRWFHGKKEQQGIYLLMIAVMCGFCAYSKRNAADFQMIRIWQGKAFLASVFLPLLFLLLLDFLQKKEHRFRWWILLLADISCCYLSSMGVLLAVFVFSIFMFLHFIMYRNLKELIKVVFCMIPSLVLGGLYILF